MCTTYYCNRSSVSCSSFNCNKCLGDLKWMDTTNNNIKLGRGVLLKLIPKRKSVY